MPPDTSSPIGFKVLVIVSRPLDLKDLPNIADQWALLDGLRRVNAPAYLKILRPPTVEGLRTEILSGYDIVHFDGHGSFGVRCSGCGWLNPSGSGACGRCEAILENQDAKGHFFFEREDGKFDSLAADELAEIIMSDPGSTTKLVFLSACESAKGGESSLMNALIKKGVPAVLGMNETVPARATMALAAPFYAGLGAGMTIARAFQAALPALKRLDDGADLQKIPMLDGPGKEIRLLSSKVAGKVSFDIEPLFGVPSHEFVGDYIRSDLPRGRKGFVSRAIDALQGGEKLVVLTGQGGIGKTVLAAEVARRLVWRYQGGIFWRSAADMKQLGLNEVLDAFASVFGPEFRTLPIDAKRDQVLSYLRNYDTSSLLVVDNAENVQDENLWRFLESISQPSAALVTTRISLPREGREIRVEEMEPFEAARLFIKEARQRSPKWGEHLSSEDTDCLDEISRILHGHPLAIKLVAPLVASRSLTSIRDELRRNPPKGVLDRFDVSYAGLTESQKELFRRMAVFYSSVMDHAIKDVCLDSVQKDDLSISDGDLGELVGKSFVDRIEVSAQDELGNESIVYRYRLHPLTRQYAIAKAGEDVLAKYRARAAKYFLGYAQHFRENFNMLEWERENILAGMDWAVEQQRSASNEELESASSCVLQFMFAIDDYLDTRGYWSEYGLRLSQAIDAADATEDRKEKSIWLCNLGTLAQKTGDYDEARKLYQQSLKIYQDLDDKKGASYVLGNLGVLAQTNGDYDEARQLYQQTIDVANQLEDKSSLSRGLHQLGNLAYMIGDYDEARGLYQQSMEIKQALGDKSGVSRSLHQLGILAQDTGDYDEARRLYQQSMEIDQSLGDKSGVSKSLHQLALLEERTGNVKEALRLIRQAEIAFKGLGSPYEKQARQVRERLERK